MIKKVLSVVLLGVVMLAASFAGAQVVTSAQGFSVSAPALLANAGTTSGVSDYGLPFTLTKYTLEMSNGDAFAVGVANYSQPLDVVSLQHAIDKVSAGNKVIAQNDTTISGYPAKSVVVGIDDNTRLGYVVTLRGSTLYMFVFTSNVKADYLPGESPAAFFNSASLN